MLLLELAKVLRLEDQPGPLLDSLPVRAGGGGGSGGSNAKSAKKALHIESR